MPPFVGAIKNTTDLNMVGAQPYSGGGTPVAAIGTLAVGDTAAGGFIGGLSAAATVDIYTSYACAQTSAGQTLTLRSPTTTTATLIDYVFNSGSASFLMYGATVPVGQWGIFLWSGAAWSAIPAFTLGGNATGASEALGPIDNFPLSLKTNDIVRLTVLNGAASSGFVGIGTVMPTARLHVVEPTAGANVNVATFSGTATGGVSLSLLNLSSRTTALLMGSAAGSWAFFTDPLGANVQAFAFQDVTAGASRMFFDAAGRCGLGSSTPNAAAQLDMESTTAGLAINRLTTAEETTLVALPPSTQVVWYNSTLRAYRWYSTTATAAQTFDSLVQVATKTSTYAAAFNELIPCDPTTPFAVTLPVITPASKGSRVVVTVIVAGAVGGASPKNQTVTAGTGNTISGGPTAGSVVISGKSTIVLESDGGTNWVVLVEPATPATPATFAAGNQTLTRIGKVSRFVAPAVLGAGRTYTFSNTGALPGDIAWVSLPTHDANTLIVADAAAATLATYAATLAGGGCFIFNGTQWEVLMAGNSTS